MLHDVRDVGYVACGVVARPTVHVVLVVVVVVHRRFARVHDQREIRRALCRVASGSLHRVRTLARVGGFVQAYCK